MQVAFYPLLFGLLLAGIPILIHLIMQQKPKHLPFPAFRFLQQKHRTNQRSLRLRHLLLLLLRMFLIAALCLALARPRIFSEGLINLGTDRPVDVVLLVDTSPSMEYTSGGKTRLDEAKQRAQALLDELPEGSKVAILDSADNGGEWAQSPTQARDQLAALRIRPANFAVTRQFGQAFKLLNNVSQGPDGELPPRFLFILSDRTRESWDDHDTKKLTVPEGVLVLFLDVGVKEPADIALADLELPRQVVGPSDPFDVRVTVRATGAGCDTFATCAIDGEAAGERKAIKLAAGASEVVTFSRQLADLKPGPHRVEVKLGNNDALPLDNARFATFEVRGGRQALVLADNPADARLLKLALDVGKNFRCDVKKPAEAVKAFEPKKLLAQYKLVCLIDVAKPDRDLWGLLEEYVRRGGALAIMPGTDLDPDAYNKDEAARRLLPAQFEHVVEVQDAADVPEANKGVAWRWEGPAHPFLAPFLEWKKTADVAFFRPENLPRARRYWKVAVDEAAKDVTPVAFYADKQKDPALVERTPWAGRVLLFTTGFDGRKEQKSDQPYWNNYLQGDAPFYVVVVNEAARYLVGDAQTKTLNYLSGQMVTVALPPEPRKPVYILQGPGLTAAEATIARSDDQNVLRIPQAVYPGNYWLALDDQDGRAGFSVNVKPEEWDLSRVEADKIEAVLGKESLPPPGQAVSLHDALQGNRQQPLDLFPGLMLALLLVLALENLLANKFYRRPKKEDTGS
jgi:hypothetical protein